MTVGGGWQFVADGGWQLVVGGGCGWRSAAVGSWWSLGAVLNQKIGVLKDSAALALQGPWDADTPEHGGPDGEHHDAHNHINEDVQQQLDAAQVLEVAQDGRQHDHPRDDQPDLVRPFAVRVQRGPAVHVALPVGRHA